VTRGTVYLTPAPPSTPFGPVPGRIPALRAVPRPTVPGQVAAEGRWGGIVADGMTKELS